MPKQADMVNHPPHYTSDMENALGRHLSPGEVVIIPTIRVNMEPKRWKKSQPAGSQMEDKVKWAVEILKQYAPQHLKNTTL